MGTVTVFAASREDLAAAAYDAVWLVTDLAVLGDPKVARFHRALPRSGGLARPLQSFSRAFGRRSARDRIDSRDVSMDIPDVPFGVADQNDPKDHRADQHFTRAA